MEMPKFTPCQGPGILPGLREGWWVQGWGWSWLAGKGIGILERQPARLKPKLRSSQMVPSKFKWAGQGPGETGEVLARLVEHDSPCPRPPPAPHWPLQWTTSQVEGEAGPRESVCPFPSPSLSCWLAGAMISGHQAEVPERRQSLWLTGRSRDFSAWLIPSNNGQFPSDWRSSDLPGALSWPIPLS